MASRSKKRYHFFTNGEPPLYQAHREAKFKVIFLNRAACLCIVPVTTH